MATGGNKYMDEILSQTQKSELLVQETGEAGINKRLIAAPSTNEVVDATSVCRGGCGHQAQVENESGTVS